MVNNLATQATQLIYGRKKKNDVLSTSFKKKIEIPCRHKMCEYEFSAHCICSYSE
jgi:hypothetical protein